jgi:hypothetical protein
MPCIVSNSCRFSSNFIKYPLLGLTIFNLILSNIMFSKVHSYIQNYVFRYVFSDMSTAFQSTYYKFQKDREEILKNNFFFDKIGRKNCFRYICETMQHRNKQCCRSNANCFGLAGFNDELNEDHFILRTRSFSNYANNGISFSLSLLSLV